MNAKNLLQIFYDHFHEGKKLVCEVTFDVFATHRFMLVAGLYEDIRKCELECADN